MRRSAAQPVRICRRRFIGSLTGGLLASPLAARAQQTGTAHRIGVLEVLEAGSNVANLNAFRQRLRELGYVEGRNLVIEYRSADGRAERVPDLAIELVQLKTEVIVTNGDSRRQGPGGRRRRLPSSWRRASIPSAPASSPILRGQRAMSPGFISGLPRNWAASGCKSSKSWC